MAKVFDESLFSKSSQKGGLPNILDVMPEVTNADTKIQTSFVSIIIKLPAT